MPEYNKEIVHPDDQTQPFEGSLILRSQLIVKMEAKKNTDFFTFTAQDGA